MTMLDPVLTEAMAYRRRSPRPPRRQVPATGCAATCSAPGSTASSRWSPRSSSATCCTGSGASCSSPVAGTSSSATSRCSWSAATPATSCGGSASAWARSPPTAGSSPATCNGCARSPAARSRRHRHSGDGSLDLAVRIWPLILGVVVLLSLTTTPGPTVLTVLVVAAAVVGRIVGSFATRRWLMPVVVAASSCRSPSCGSSSRPAPWDEWEGMMLNLFLAVAGIALSFPLGVLLALGRRAGRRTDSPVGGAVVAVDAGVAGDPRARSAAASTSPT